MENEPRGVSAYIAWTLETLKLREMIMMSQQALVQKAAGDDKLPALLEAAGKAEGVPINLVIMDKERQGKFCKYVLGYALDNTKTYEGENIIKAAEVLWADLNAETGRLLLAKVDRVKPLKIGSLYGVALDSVVNLEKTDEKKLNSAKEILRKSFSQKRLTATQQEAIDLVAAKVLVIDLDKEYGIGLNKEFKIVKGQRFAKHGVVYCVVYSPNEVDSDGDSADEEEVMKACWKFMEDYSAALNLMHGRELTDKDAAVVENAIALADVYDGGTRIMKANDWYIGIRIKNPEIKTAIEKGELTGVSMEGHASAEGKS
jgi:hypothetical protein